MNNWLKVAGIASSIWAAAALMMYFSALSSPIPLGVTPPAWYEAWKAITPRFMHSLFQVDFQISSLTDVRALASSSFKLSVKPFGLLEFVSTPILLIYLACLPGYFASKQPVITEDLA